MNNEDYLAHFGILGMKWGKKNGPPYPLSAAKSAAVKKSANKDGRSLVGKIVERHKKKQFSNRMKKAKEAKAKRLEKEKKDEERKLKKYTKNPNTMLKNLDKLTPEQIEAQLKKFDMQRKLQDVKQERFQKGVKYVEGVASVAGSLGRIYDVYRKINEGENKYDRAAKEVQYLENLEKIRAIRRGDYDPYKKKDKKNKNKDGGEEPKKDSKAEQPKKESSSKESKEAKNASDIHMSDEEAKKWASNGEDWVYRMYGVNGLLEDKKRKQ